MDSNGHAPSKRILDDNRLIPTIPATTRQKPPLLIIPSANHVTSEDTSGIHVHSTASASADESEAVQVISATSGGRISPSMAKSAASLPSSIFKEALLNSISLNATSTSEYPSEFPLDEAVVKGTGADYKRKCLMSSSINIQSLHLTKRDSSGAEEYTGFGNSTPPDGKKKSGKSDKGSDKGSDKEKVVLPSPRKFMRAVSSKLSEISTQLSGKEGGKHDKGEKEEMARLGMGMKQRCLSVPNGLCNEGVAAESTTFSHAKQERPSSAGTTQGSTTETKEEKKTRHRRTMSAGGSFFFPSSNRVGGTSTSPTAAIASSSSRCTTPRSADNHSIPLSPPSVLTHKDKNNCVLARPSTPSGGLSSELQHLGIAEMHIDTATPAAAGGTGEGKEEEEETEDSPMFPDLVLGASQIILDGRQSTTSSSSFDAPVAGALSTSSSCSNFSQASTVVTSPTDPASAPSTARSTGDGVGNKRKKYAALLFHYPNLQPCLQDPALKVVAKRLNKCLKFKDELQRSLVKAETVQETETVSYCFYNIFLPY